MALGLKRGCHGEGGCLGSATRPHPLAQRTGGTRWRVCWGEGSGPVRPSASCTSCEPSPRCLGRVFLVRGRSPALCRQEGARAAVFVAECKAQMRWGGDQLGTRSVVLSLPVLLHPAPHPVSHPTSCPWDRTTSAHGAARMSISQQNISSPKLRHLPLKWDELGGSRISCRTIWTPCSS